MITEDEVNKLLSENEALFRFMGAKFEKVERGVAKLSFEYKEELSRIGGMLHGAIIFAAMDYSGSYAVRTLDVKEAYTLEFNVVFLKAMKTPPFTFLARVVRETKRYAYVEVEGFDGNNELCAKGNGIWHLIRD
ncbi:PaaI family thioesterase [Sulfurisphaera ohwakuensis]|uniref:Acyl-CoA thioesterase n=1 Tax=Sulfurisphaera ohwakuensis TaxID=69656 RepID=A0A650CIA5_SULOH|nr:PaaI family thioesterase [Sulfurisphaera ohwakuensis]MBB5253820.1 acyl-CoA thioesterase [Sulfurisphaera ohwakuensis]QGR17506.1 hotdog fold thioesterase [Sulfurisphaera ohwakuensis]